MKISKVYFVTIEHEKKLHLYSFRQNKTENTRLFNIKQNRYSEISLSLRFINRWNSL